VVGQHRTRKGQLARAIDSVVRESVFLAVSEKRSECLAHRLLPVIEANDLILPPPFAALPDRWDVGRLWAIGRHWCHLPNDTGEMDQTASCLLCGICYIIPQILFARLRHPLSSPVNSPLPAIHLALIHSVYVNCHDMIGLTAMGNPEGVPVPLPRTIILLAATKTSLALHTIEQRVVSELVERAAKRLAPSQLYKTDVLYKIRSHEHRSFENADKSSFWLVPIVYNVLENS